jgi:hypothetical protein
MGSARLLETSVYERRTPCCHAPTVGITFHWPHIPASALAIESWMGLDIAEVFCYFGIEVSQILPDFFIEHGPQ